MATIDQILAKFGVVTVMEAEFFPATATTLTAGTGLFTLDTLSISNLTQEGPVKMSKGGLNAEVVLRYGKTARLEMEDVVGRIEALKHLMGVRADDNDEPTKYFITDRFGGYYKIKGRTFVVNVDTGAREYVDIVINKFLPDSLFNLSMEAEGDLAVFNLAGEIFTDDCGIFYYIGAGAQGDCSQIAPLFEVEEPQGE
jgi:hypothetical protein